MQITRSIENCPECGGEHKDLTWFNAFTETPGVESYPFSTKCPTNNHLMDRTFNITESNTEASDGRD